MNLSEFDEDIDVDWRLWCRLCGKNDDHSISVFFKDDPISISRRYMSKDGATFEKEISLVAVIQKHFNVKIKLHDDLPKMLCTDCLSLIKSLVTFIERVERAQVMHRALRKSTENVVFYPKKFRMKYGLLDKDRQEIFTHYVDTKQEASEIEKVYENENETISSDPIDCERPRIVVKIKNIRSAETKAQVANLDKYNYVSDNEEIQDTFNEEKIDTIQCESNDDKGDSGDEMNLADLQTALNVGDPSLDTHCHDREAKKNRNFLIKQDVNCSGSNKRVNSLIDACSERSQKFKLTGQSLSQNNPNNTSLSRLKISCNHCSRVFRTQKQLERHSKTHLPLELKRVVPCPYCDKKFIYKSLVTKHVRFFHMNERSIICEECGYAVRTMGALREHMLSHTDYAPFECSVCHKGFKNKSGLNKHKEIHDEKKHVCAECGKLLNSRTTLNQHLLVHSDKMQHKCDYCGRAFKLAKTLKAHLIIHTGLKPYACDFCDRTFTTGPSCRVHKKKAHPKELAELDASGTRSRTKNIPTIEALKAYARNIPKADDNGSVKI